MRFSTAKDIAASLAPAFFLTLTATSEAFDYPEQAYISAHAICLVASGSLQGERYSISSPPGLATAPPVKRSRGDVLKALGHAWGGTLLCGDNRLLDDEPPGCFSLGDLPALAADHAASPLLIKWRWFDACLKASQTTS